MRGGIAFFCFLFALPFLAAAGHDIYLAYEDNGLSLEEPLKVTDLTWMLVTYTPDLYDSIQQSVSAETRDAVIIPLLRMKTMVFAALPAITLYIYLIITKLLGLWPFSDRTLFNFGSKKKGFAFKSSDKEKERVRYKRK